jgi:GntR family transcriptional regulator/MocR family aminotransferase
MQALAPEHVVYAGTTSKSLAPGLRLGWLVVPVGLLELVVEARRLTDGPSTVDQLTLAELIVSGGYDRQVRRARLAYRRRRDFLVRALERRVPLARVTGIEAGQHVVLELAPGVTEQEAIARSAERGLVVESVGDYSAGVQPHRPALVVGYGTPPAHAWSGAVARLCAALEP